MAGKVDSTFDVATVVNELMKREMVQLGRLTDSESFQKIQVSLYGQLKNYLQAVNTASNKVKHAFDAVTHAVVSSNESIASAKITSSDEIYAGKHDIVVTALAKADVKSSNVMFTSRSQALNKSGSLQFSIGQASFSVNVDAADTLEQIRSKINNAASNIGVTANIVASTDVNGDDEFSLVIASDNTGIDHAVTIGGTLANDFDISHVISAASDAEFTFDGKSVKRSSNIITDVMDGLAFGLKSTGTVSFTIVDDASKRNEEILTSFKELIHTYNVAMDYIDENVAERNITDGTINSIKATLRQTFFGSLSGVGEFSTLLDLGVKTAKAVEAKTKSGNTYTKSATLEINEEKFVKLLNENITNVQKFFTDAANGFDKAAQVSLDRVTGFGGTIAARTTSFNEQISRLHRSIGSEESRLEVIKAGLIKKYSELNTILSQFDRMSSYLENTFDSMRFSNKK